MPPVAKRYVRRLMLATTLHGLAVLILLTVYIAWLASGCNGECVLADRATAVLLGFAATGALVIIILARKLAANFELRAGDMLESCLLDGGDVWLLMEQAKKANTLDREREVVQRLNNFVSISDVNKHLLLEADGLLTLLQWALHDDLQIQLAAIDALADLMQAPFARVALIKEEGHKIILATASTNDAVIIARAMRCLRLIAESAEFCAVLAQEGTIRDLARAARRDDLSEDALLDIVLLARSVTTAAPPAVDMSFPSEVMQLMEELLPGAQNAVLLQTLMMLMALLRRQVHLSNNQAERMLALVLQHCTSVDGAVRQTVADIFLAMAKKHEGLSAMCRVPSQLGGRLSLLVEVLGPSHSRLRSTVLEVVAALLDRATAIPALRHSLCPHLLDIIERAPPTPELDRLRADCEYQLSLR